MRWPLLLIALCLSGCGGEQPATPETGAVPADQQTKRQESPAPERKPSRQTLDYISPGNAAILVAHPRKLLESEPAKAADLVALLDAFLPPKDQRPFELEELERVTILASDVVVGQPPKLGLILSFAEPVDRQKLLTLLPAAKETAQKNVVYRLADQAQPPWPDALSIVDSRTALLAEESMLLAMAKQDAKDDPLVALLQQADWNSDLILVARMDDPGKFDPQALGEFLPAAAPKELQELRRKLQGLILTANLSRQPLLRMQCRMADAAAAAKLQAVLQTVKENQTKRFQEAKPQPDQMPAEARQTFHMTEAFLTGTRISAESWAVNLETDAPPGFAGYLKANLAPLLQLAGAARPNMPAENPVPQAEPAEPVVAPPPPEPVVAQPPNPDAAQPPANPPPMPKPATEGAAITFQPLPAEWEVTTFALTEGAEQLVLVHEAANKLTVWNPVTRELAKTIDCEGPGAILCRRKRLYVARPAIGVIEVYNREENYQLEKTVDSGVQSPFYLSAPMGGKFKEELLVTGGGSRKQATLVNIRSGKITLLQEGSLGAVTVDTEGKYVFIQGTLGRTAGSTQAKEYAGFTTEPKKTKAKSLAGVGSLYYQVHKDGYWFSHNNIHRPEDLTPMLANDNEMLIPDYAAPALYLIKAGELTARRLDTGFDLLGKRPLRDAFSAGNPIRANENRYRTPVALTMNGKLLFFVYDPARKQVAWAETEPFLELQPSRQPGPNAEQDASAAADKKLKLAKQLIDKRNNSLAKKWLEDLIRDYPETPAAREATELLKGL